MTPSPYQEAILNNVRLRRPTLVQACAGAGKTTTLRLICEVIRRDFPRASIFCAAFNRDIVAEFSRKLPPGVACSTLHSHGFAALKRASPGVVLDDNKLRNIVRAVAPMGAHGDLMAAVPVAMGLVLDPHNEAAVLNGLRRCGKTLEDPDLSLPLVGKVVNACLDMHSTISYDEMIYFPVRYPAVPVARFDFVLIDEAQDMNEAQQALIGRTLKQDGILIAVGDRYQSVYGFRGADPAAMHNMRVRFQLDELSLPVSYRCPTSHVALAQQVIGEGGATIITAADGAADGIVRHRQERDRGATLGGAQPGDLVLCRLNAPLMPAALELIRAGRKACVRGKDLGGELSRLVQRQQAPTIPGLIVKLKKWERREREKALAQDNERAAEAASDKVETITAVIDACDTEDTSEVVERLNRIFSDETNGQGVVFSSVHRAKGLEAERVIILGPEMMPLVRRDSTAESLQQEKNLKYVAMTRSKSELTLQPLPPRRRTAPETHRGLGCL
jgi:hypothetical protein